MVISKAASVMNAHISVTTHPTVRLTPFLTSRDVRKTVFPLKAQV